MSGNLALVVDQAGAALEPGTHDTVVLRHADGRIERVGIRALGAVVLHGDVTLSTALLRKLAAHGVSVAALSGQAAWMPAGFTQLPQRHAETRHHQHLAYADPARRLDLACACVIAKLQSMLDFARGRAPDAVAPIYGVIQQASEAGDIPSLMGIEGAASARHFALLAEIYGHDGRFRFERRTRQPPCDAPNALMSLSYTLAQAQAAQLALRTGLDLQIGFLHGLHRQRESFALDLIEPARPLLDDWVHELLVRRKALTPSMFTCSERGKSWLTKEGRAVFYPLWFNEGYRIARRAMRPLLARILASLRFMTQTSGPKGEHPF